MILKDSFTNSPVKGAYIMAGSFKVRTDGLGKTNAAKTNLYIIGAKNDDNYFIYNANGILVQKGLLSKPRIDIKHLSAGTYLIRIKDELQAFINI